MRQRVASASSAGHSDTTRPAADDHPTHSLLQAKASKFLKNLSNFARGGKNSSTHPYNDSCRRGQLKPYLSQPALAVANFSPEQDESSSSASPSPQSGFPALTVVALDARSQSFGLPNGIRSDDPPHPRTTGDTRFPHKTISHTARSPDFLTIPTSPASRRGVSFDIPRSEGGGLDIMSPLTTPPESPTNIPDHRSPYRMATTSSPDLAGFGWSSTTNLVSQAPKIEGLPDIGESIDPNLFKSLQRTGQPPADEVPNLTPDRTPTSSFRSPMSSQPPNYHEATKSPVLTPANMSPAILPQKRVALLRLSSMPPPAFTVNDEDGSVRLSPALMGRRFPTSVRPLPPTSIAPRSHSPAPSLSNASRTRLRSIPALAMNGTNDGDGSGDDDDDDDDDHVPNRSPPMSEDEDEGAIAEREEGSSASVRTNASPEGPPPDPSISPRVVDGEEAPASKPPHDYFSINPARKDSLGWTFSGSNPDRAPPTPKERPTTLYHQPSKSMVNLPPSRPRRDLSIIDEETKGKGRATDSVSSAVATETNILPEGPRLQRRRSLPMFTEATEPPPYPSLEIPTKSGPKVFPRDEEGMERLPPYTNDILLSAILPRKLEFTSPGVQARDRKWRRTLCVLEGTAFRVFEPPASVVGIGAVGRWWERRVGVGDLTSDVPLPKMTGTAVPGSQKIDGDLDYIEDQSSVRSTPTVVVPDREAVSPSRKSKLRPTGFRHRNGNTSGSSSRRQSGEAYGEGGRLSVSVPRPSVSSVTTGRPSATSHRRAASPMSTGSARHEYGPCPRRCQALRVYTLQQAESGLASDYLKRRNVIRVRMEGEQFLLQAPSVQAVVEWIEGFQTATGIALDLDERPMPKGPMFPRRRRRRAQAPTNPNARAGGRTDSFRQYPRS